MPKWLKDHFIPHQGNAHQPHFLRWKAASLLLLTVLALEGLYLAGALFVFPTNRQFAAIFASVLVEQTNAKRQTEELGLLTTNSVLMQAAQLKANDMAARGYFAHDTPDGKTPWYWFDRAGYDYAAAGENLAVNFTDSKDVTEAWMRSPTHRANILNGNYTEIGIATAQGAYKGRNAIFVVQMFGRPSLAPRFSTAGTTVAPLGETAPPLAVTPVILPTSRVAGVVTEKNISPPNEEEPAAVVDDPQQKIASERITALRSTSGEFEEPIAGRATQKLSISQETALAPSLAMHTPTRLEKFIAAPREAITALLLLIAVLITIALALAVFIKIRIQYPRIIANGFLLVAIAVSLVIFNAAFNLTVGVI